MAILIFGHTEGLGAIDLNGNLFHNNSNVAYYTSKWTGTNIVAAGKDNGIAYVINMSSTGTINWQTRINNIDEFAHCAIDSNGDIYGAGVTDNYERATILKLNSTGSSILWQREIYDSASTSTEQAFGVAVDNSDNVFVCGGSNDTNAAWVAKYDSSGNIQWQRNLDRAGSNEDGTSVATDSNGNVYMIVANHPFQILVAKWNSSGVLQWKKTVSEGSGNKRGRGVIVNSTGDVYISGTTDSVNPTLKDFVIAKLNSSGALQWARLLGDSANNESVSSTLGRYSLALDSSENVYGIVSAYQSPSTTWNKGIIVKYNPSGAIQWQRELESPGSGQLLEPYDIDISGSAYQISGGLNRDSGTRGFVFKAPIDGSETGTYGTVTYAASTINEQEWASVTSTDATTFTDSEATYTDQAGSATLVSVTRSHSVFSKS